MISENAWRIIVILSCLERLADINSSVVAFRSHKLCIIFNIRPGLQWNLLCMNQMPQMLLIWPFESETVATPEPTADESSLCTYSYFTSNITWQQHSCSSLNSNIQMAKQWFSHLTFLLLFLQRMKCIDIIRRGCCLSSHLHEIFVGAFHFTLSSDSPGLAQKELTRGLHAL